MAALERGYTVGKSKQNMAAEDTRRKQHNRIHNKIFENIVIIVLLACWKV